MGRLLVGKDVSARIAARAREGVAELAVRGVVPTLAILRIGERPDDLAYERTAIKRAEALGVSVRQVVLPADVGTDEVLKAVHAVNG
ncbi:MAG: tetrahydrofolate dehydrogenase/cyclohydrolase catalytic domain-containing protein, partial [Slackia sp.]|nr:tetrahydrofolate dehydrogenase/cyclohydrolase catalytic domain-containing protein [Slackia sp.]